MASALPASPQSETSILARLIHPEGDDLSAAAAEAWLSVRFEGRDLERLHDLLSRNQAGELVPEERAEMETYLRVSSFLDLMHAKARRSLKRHG